MKPKIKELFTTMFHKALQQVPEELYRQQLKNNVNGPDFNARVSGVDYIGLTETFNA